MEKLSNIEFIFSPIDEVTAAILDSIREHFLKERDDGFIDPQIEVFISEYIDEFKDDLYCLLEYPYVDKVYRDSFYNYYSSKHSTYLRDCIRVSLFKKKITKNDFINPTNHKKLSRLFLGFFIVRPTVNALIGRSIINPEAFIDSNIRICRFKVNALILGVKLVTEGFPHSSQDEETIKCAETTIWALMEYFGNKYPEYSPVLPHEIHQALRRFSYQRQLPSNGLTMDQISYALMEFGFGTRIYSRDSYPDELKKIIDYYIESGIPILAGLESGEMGHVIIIHGKKYPAAINQKEVPRETFFSRGKDVEYIDWSSIPAKYVVQDDNLSPYRIISLDRPGEHYKGDDQQKFAIDSIVVPLYPKIYLEAVVANELILQIMKDSKVGFDFDDGFVQRTFLASSRSFKNHIANLSDIEGVLKYTLLMARMPKFIWCREIYQRLSNKITEKQPIGLIILDATEANNTSIDALIFAGYPDRCITMVENNFASLQHRFKNYSCYNNLK